MSAPTVGELAQSALDRAHRIEGALAALDRGASLESVLAVAREQLHALAREVAEARALVEADALTAAP